MGKVEEVATKEGKYIYCIIATKEPRTFGRLGIGDRGDEVYTICFEDIAAVVSNSPIVTYPTSSDNMFAHERAIEEAMKEHTVLPVKFVTIAENEEKVKNILEKEHDRFTDLLDKLKGRKELSLKAIFNEKAVYKEILEKNTEIKKLKAAIAPKPPAKTYYQRMAIGKMVEQALEREKEEYKKVILDTLEPMAEDIKINDTYGERMIVNAAFLIAEDKEEEFDQRVRELDAKYSDRVKFKYVGTLPPFNFVNLIIETGKY